MINVVADCSHPESKALVRSVDVRGGLEDAIDAVGHVEAMGPIVVDNRPWGKYCDAVWSSNTLT